MRIRFATYPGRATRLLLSAAVLGAGFMASGCGSSDRDDVARGSTLTIYTSLPRHGLSARDAEAVAAGERMALADAHGRAGGHRLRLVELDDSDPQKAGIWDPSAVERNAKQAAKDPSTIAYIGELDYGGSAISVPVTNAKAILQVSPGDGLTSLTQVQPGGFKTSPARYYPNGRRTFVRIVPTDLGESSELMRWVRERGTARVAIVHDDELFGREMSAQAVAAAPSQRVSVAEVEEARADEKSYADLARKIASKDPEAVVYFGLGGPQAGLVFRQLAAALPGIPLYGSSGLVGDRATTAGVPPVELLDPTLPESAYGQAGKRVLARLERQLGGTVSPRALYGYEAMRLAIDAIDRAGRRSDDRSAVSAAAFAPGVRRSAIGAYAIQRTGDVAPVRFGAYRLYRGGLYFEGARPAPPARRR
ncbi:MAG: ABC transporter substrate-binding protein [Gaiellaceae bacterium]